MVQTVTFQIMMCSSNKVELKCAWVILCSSAVVVEEKRRKCGLMGGGFIEQQAMQLSRFHSSLSVAWKTATKVRKKKIQTVITATQAGRWKGAFNTVPSWSETPATTLAVNGWVIPAGQFKKWKKCKRHIFISATILSPSPPVYQTSFNLPILFFSPPQLISTLFNSAAVEMRRSEAVPERPFATFRVLEELVVILLLNKSLLLPLKSKLLILALEYTVLSLHFYSSAVVHYHWHCGKCKYIYLHINK